MSYVDEGVFGKEVVDALPALVEKWVDKTHERKLIYLYNTSAIALS